MVLKSCCGACNLPHEVPFAITLTRDLLLAVNQPMGGLMMWWLFAFPQVHAAVLAGSNKEVVIKVLRPGTGDVLLTDLNFVSLQHI